MDAEKFAYEMIEVPDDRLVQAIYKGMGRRGSSEEDSM